MNKDTLQAWFKLTDQNRRNIFEETARQMGLPLAAAAEKDWWVVRTLELVFETEIARNTVFKGGTSLSKAWNLIDRFSEDIDLALDRRFLGFDGAMTSSQVAKLRRHSAKYISERYLPQIDATFQDNGFTDVVVQLVDVKSADEDPIKIAVNYPSVTEPSVYLPSRVLIEIGSRSLMEPQSNRSFSSFVGESFMGRDFADNGITIPTVIPERTFLEKIFLLHEEFQQPPAKIKAIRKTRHLYDLEKLMDTKYGVAAMADSELYWNLVEHRRIMTPVRGIDYGNHAPDKINPVPPTALLTEWRKDYEQMQQSMIYRESVSFQKLMERIVELKSRVNNIGKG